MKLLKQMKQRMDRLFSVTAIRKMLAASDLALPFEAWNSTRNVLVSIIAASFIINLVSLAFPMALLQVYDRIIPNVSLNTLVLLVIGVTVALIIEAVMKVARTYVSSWADAKFEHITGCRAFSSLIRSSLLNFEEDGSGIHLKRINALNNLRDFYSGKAVVSLVDLPFLFILLFLVGYIAGWLVIIPTIMILIFIVSTVVQSRDLQPVMQERAQHDDRRFNFIIETLNNIHTVKSLTMEAQMMRRYERLQKTASLNDYALSSKSSDSMALGMTMSQLTLVLVVSVGSLLVIFGQLTVGGLAACTLLSGRCLQPVNTMVQLWTRLKSINLARADIDKVLNMPQESTDQAPAIKKLEGAIELKNLCFRYGDDLPLVINNLNFKIAAKEAIGITGQGLSGKSTLMWLIQGILQPTAGTVLFDGMDISRFDVHSVRQQVAYLPQKCVLFSGTMMENLTMFRGDEYYERAREAVEQVGLSHIIDDLPNGYDTKLANATTEILSRGINQRIAIARALVQDAPIVIFDEANTAVDIHGDAIIRKMLESLVGKCTLIIVSHRPSILNVAQKKYVLNNGRLELQK